MCTRVSPAEAYRLMTEQGYVHIDVRTELEFAAGHPAGALNVPFALGGAGGMAENPLFVPLLRSLFRTTTPLLLACRSGQRSWKAALLLERSGFERLAEQRAGFDGARDPFGGRTEAGWLASGLPVAQGDSGACSYAGLLLKAGM